MKKKIKVILILIIMLLLALNLYLTYYKFILNTSDNSANLNNKINYILSDEINVTYDIDYEKEYNLDIINENITKKEFFVSQSNNIIYGDIHIGSDKKLYINDSVSNYRIKLISNKNFLTLKEKKVYNIGLSVYALSTDGILYLITLNSVNIKDVNIKEIKLETPVKKFTTLKLENFNGGLDYVNVVMLENGKMIDIDFKIPYNEKTININNEYLILEDNSIVNYNGMVMRNSDKTIVKLKSILILNKPNDEFQYSSNVLLITEDNKIIYTLDNVVIDYEKTILKIEDKDNNITIYFTDKSKVKIEGYYYENINQIK